MAEEKSMAAINEWIEGHEKLCADRYNGLREDLKSLNRVGLGLLLAIIGWLAVQVYNGEPARVQAQHVQATTP